MSQVIIAGDTSGTITLQAPAVSGSSVLTLPATTATLATLTTPSFASTIGVGGATASASGAGISFPATQSASSNANTLDDYEEGTWTPIVGGTATYNAGTVGTYIKVGSLVTIFGILNINVLGTGSATVIQGLPFSTSQGSQGSIGYFASLASSVVFIQPYVDTNNPTLIQFRTLATAGATMGNANVFGNSTRIDFTMTYYTT